MGIGESIRLALEGLRANKMRSILTMLGIIIGIGAVIGILTVGNGLTGSITGSMSSLGVSNITVSLRSESDRAPMMASMMGMVRPGEEDLMTDEMVEALRSRYGAYIAGVSLSEGAGSGQAKDGRLYANLSLTGVNEDYAGVNNLTLLSGRWVRQKDLDGSRSVCVVSDKLVNNLFGGDAEAALGQDIHVTLDGESLTFRVVGVYEYDASAMGFSMVSEQDVSTGAYIPLTTAKHISGSSGGYASMTVQAAAGIDSAAMAQDVQSFLNRYYVKNEDYSVFAMAMSTMVESMSSISLLVGGIGVMNIMLVSVTERTREIGTRKALGATNNDIRLQFVVESIIVCLIGGVIGIAAGTLLGYWGSSLISEPALPTLGSIALAVGFSMAIGVFFGYYPANKAARLDPIEALRYE